MGDDGPDRRVVVGTGRDLDKQDRYEVSKHVARDWDVWKLSLFGPVLWSAVRLAVVVGTVAYVAYSLHGYGTQVASLADGLAASAASVDDVLRAHAVEALLAVTVGSWVLSRAVDAVGSELGGVRAQVASLGAQLRHVAVIADLDTWLPQNYWHPFTAHLSDRDPLVVLSNADLDAAVSGTYADAPYYENVFVDALYVRARDLPPRRAAELWWFDVRVRTVRQLLAAGLLAVVVLGRFDGVAATLALVALAGVVAVAVLSLPALPTVALAVGGAAVAVGVPVPVTATPGPTLELAAVAVLAGGVLLGGFLSRHVAFHRRFYGDSAGFSEFGTLTSDAEAALFEDEGHRLGNSLVGYGIFYVSEFLAAVVSREGPYRVVAGTGDSAARDDALRAGTALLRSSIPSPGPPDGDDAVTLELAGVDYLRSDYSDRWRDRVPGLRRPAADAFGDGDRRGVDTAGRRAGVRLPVKRFVSVPWPDADDGFPAYLDPSWTDDELHYLLLGGAEHQAGLVAFIRHLKRRGYENVDLLENAFADEDALAFVSEYFVSSAIRGEEDFRGAADSEGVFLLLRHRVSTDPDRWIHVCYGLGALESKVAFLYWFDAFPEFEHDADVLYRVSYDAAGVDDVGDLYADPSWLRDGDRAPTFEWGEPTWVVAPDDATLGCARVDLRVTVEGADD